MRCAAIEASRALESSSPTSGLRMYRALLIESRAACISATSPGAVTFAQRRASFLVARSSAAAARRPNGVATSGPSSRCGSFQLANVSLSTSAIRRHSCRNAAASGGGTIVVRTESRHASQCGALRGAAALRHRVQQHLLHVAVAAPRPVGVTAPAPGVRASSAPCRRARRRRPRASPGARAAPRGGHAGHRRPAHPLRRAGSPRPSARAAIARQSSLASGRRAGEEPLRGGERRVSGARHTREYVGGRRRPVVPGDGGLHRPAARICFDIE